MTTDRLASHVLVSALLSRATSEGGFGAVLAKGDPTAGAIGVILLEKGENPRFFERILQPDGAYRWQQAGPASGDSAALNAFLDRRRDFDRDLWLVELDIPSAERFAAEMNDAG